MSFNEEDFYSPYSNLFSENLFNNNNDSFCHEYEESFDPFFNKIKEETILDDNHEKLYYNPKSESRDTGKTNESTGENNSQKESQENPLESKNTENGKNLQKKRKNSKSNDQKHSKYSSDNTIRKVKHIILDGLMKFINKRISEIYQNNIGFGISRKQLLILNQSQKIDAKIDFNRKFMEKKLFEIFSEKISTRYTSFPEDFNKGLIIKLMNEKDLEKKAYFQKLFNLTFYECLSHFRGEKNINELNGLTLFYEYIKDNGEDEDYNNQLDYYVFNFEKIINNKRKRKPRNTSQNDNLNNNSQKNKEKEVTIISIDS